MSTVFGFAMPLDLNVVVNHFMSLSIFVQVQSHLSVQDQLQYEIQRLNEEYPQCKADLVFAKQVAPMLLGPPKLAKNPEFFQTWVLEVRLYGIKKTIWYIQGDPEQAYSAMYPYFFHQPTSVIVDDLKGAVDGMSYQWEEYVSRSEADTDWMKPKKVEKRSQQLIF